MTGGWSLGDGGLRVRGPRRMLRTGAEQTDESVYGKRERSGHVGCGGCGLGEIYWMLAGSNDSLIATLGAAAMVSSQLSAADAAVSSSSWTASRWLPSARAAS